MKSFDKWFKMYEATLKGNPGIPGEDDDSDKYLSDVERRAKELARTNNVRVPNSIMEITELTRKSFDSIRGKEKELQKLAYDLIMNEYGSIINGVCELNIEIVRPGTLSFDESKLKKKEEEKEREKPKEKKPKVSFKDLFNKGKEEPKKEEDNKEEYELEVHKRKITNNIIQGEAKNTKHVIHSDFCKEGLIKIYGETKGKEIHSIFDRITKIMDSLDWVIPEEHQRDMWNGEGAGGFAGKSEVKWDKKPKNDEESEEDEDDESAIENNGDINEEKAKEQLEGGKATIVAYGVDFPMLIHEAVKGIYELIATAGQSKNIEIAKKVQIEADDLFNELEDLRYGPFIAADLRDFISIHRDIDKYPNIRESFFGRLVILEAKEFLSLMKGILLKSPSARRKVDSMIDEIIKELDEWELSQHIDTYEEEDNEKSDDNFADDVLDRITKGEEVEEKEETEIDYSKLSRRELQSEIDDALDNGDFKLVKKLSSFLKESFKYKR
jgi:hypothetical protein